MKQFLIILAIVILGFMGYQYFIRGKIAPDQNGPMGGGLSNTPAATLENTNWTVVQIGSVEVPDAGITATFADGRLGGKDGCNNYSTTYQLNGKNMSIDSQIAGTLMACDEATMVLGSLYTKTLGDVTGYALEGDILSLLGSENSAIITLQKQTQSLTGVMWQVTGYNNGKGGVTTPIDQTSLTLAFEGESAIMGSACNSFTGEYSVGDAQDIAIGELAVTRMFCAESEGAMDQETQFLAALKKSAKYERELSRLTLRDTEGNIQITANAVGAL